MSRAAIVLCLTSLACDAEPRAGVTWHGDIAPLIARHCGGCHVEGGVGPMPLDTLERAQEHARLVLGAVDAGVMPPWMPSDACHPLADVRRIGADERELLRAWIDDDMPAGDARHARPFEPPPRFEPTETLAVASGYLPAVGDDYHCFVVERDFAADTYVTGASLELGSGQVHHVVVYAIQPAQLAEVHERDEAAPGAGYPCYAQPVSTGFADQDAFIRYLAGGPLPNFDFPIQLGAWVPGVAPRLTAPGTAYRVPRGSKLVVQIHYSPHGAPVPDTTRLALVTTDDAPAAILKTRPVAVLDLDIPAGAPAAVNARAFPYHGEAPLEIVGVMAHMHLLGSAFETRVVRAGGDACLLDIPRWDFHWQESYRFPPDSAVRVMPGDAIEVSCTHDNSAAHQPPAADGSLPAPRRVGWGEGTRDEMCIFYYTAIEPFGPPPVIESTPSCAPATECVDACAAPSLDCVLACREADTACQLCSVRAGLRCSGFTCLGILAEASDCLVTCLESSLMLGGNLGRCLAAECTADYERALACIDAPLDTAECRAELAACDVDFR